MKLTLKLILVVCLCCSSAFADGEMSGGAFTDGDMTSGGKADGDQGNGGLTVNDPNQNNPILIFVQKYLFSIFG